MIFAILFYMHKDLFFTQFGCNKAKTFFIIPFSYCTKFSFHCLNSLE